jgi:hypothetical protein
MAKDEAEPTPEEQAEEKFVEGVVTRGEAAKRDEHGELPPGVTHEIVEEPEGKLPKIRRRRFTVS